MNNILKLSIFAILLSFTIFYCSDSPTGTSDLITINIPINQKSVRAIAHYAILSDYDSLLHLHVSSFYYDSTFVSNDTTYLLGSYERLDADSIGDPVSGRIILSMTDDWVFFQSGEIVDAGIDLIKPIANVTVDTTSLPTEFFSYFPVYPRTLIRNETYSIYRPANGGESWGYAGVYREFNAGDIVSWDDRYDSNLGIEVLVEHILLGFKLNFDLIIDNHGIVNSQSAIMIYGLKENSEVQGVMINRRIVDYSDPSSVNSLTYYVNEVKEKGLMYH